MPWHLQTVLGIGHWHYFILFYGWVVFHCIYVPHLLYPFMCQWTFRLLPCLGYCESEIILRWFSERKLKHLCGGLSSFQIKCFVKIEKLSQSSHSNWREEHQIPYPVEPIAYPSHRRSRTWVDCAVANIKNCATSVYILVNPFTEGTLVIVHVTLNSLTSTSTQNPLSNKLLGHRSFKFIYFRNLND